MSTNIHSRQMVEMECSSSVSEDMTSAITDRCREISSDLSHPVVSEAVDSVLALVETIEPVSHHHVQRLVKEATDMMVALCVLSLKPGWPGAHLEETTKTVVKTLGPIQDVAKGYVEKNVVLRAIAIRDRRKMKKYRKKLARLRERLLLKSLLHISIPSRDVAEEPIRTPSTETIMKLDDEDFAETTGEQHPDDRGQVDQEASSEEQSTDVSATMITPGSARGTRKRMGGARTVNPFPTPIDPYGGDQPGGSVRHPTEPPPRRTGYFSRFPQPTTVQVFFTPAIQSCIDHSRHRTTYGSYRNEGQHATNHGSSRPNNTYSAGPGPSNVDECLPPGTEPMTADNHWVPSHCDGCYQHAEVPITMYDSSSPRQRGEDMHVEVEATEATSNASLPSSRTTPAGPRL